VGGGKFGATERAHQRNGDRIDAKWRRPGLATIFHLTKLPGGMNLAICPSISFSIF